MKKYFAQKEGASPEMRILALVLCILALMAAIVRADETCSSPYLARIEGQEEFVYVWTLGDEKVGDGSDKLVVIDVKPGSPTESHVKLDPILAAYGQAVDARKDASSPAGPLNHTLRVYLIDREGRIRNIYSSGTLDVRLVLADVRTLILEDKLASRVKP